MKTPAQKQKDYRDRQVANKGLVTVTVYVHKNNKSKLKDIAKKLEIESAGETYNGLNNG